MCASPLSLFNKSSKVTIYHRPSFFFVDRPTDQHHTTNKTAPSVSHRRRQSCVFPNILGRRHAPPFRPNGKSPRFGNGSKKAQPISAAYKDREIHISLNRRHSSPVSRMLRFSSAYVAHTHKLLSDHLQTTVAYQINVVRNFDYFLLEEIRIDVASLYIVGYHKIVIVRRGWLILILRWSVPRSRYLIRRLHQMSMFLALVLQEFCLAGILFVTPLATLRTSRDAAHRLAETWIR